MRQLLLYLLPLWVLTAGWADEECYQPTEESSDCACEDRGYFVLPCEKARPYDRMLETEPSWAGKREDAFYDFLTR
jgi:hypothetical protein